MKTKKAGKSSLLACLAFCTALLFSGLVDAQGAPPKPQSTSIAGQPKPARPKVVQQTTASPTPVSPQPTVSVADKKAAAQIYDQALKSFQAGQFPKAAELLEQAYKRDPQPQYKLYLARAQAEAGKLLSAKASYTEVATLHVPPGAPPLFQRSVELAQTELVSVQRRIPTVEVVPSTDSTVVVKMSLDGAKAEAASVRQLNPGDHKIDVFHDSQPNKTNSSSQSTLVATLNLSLAEGGRNTISVPPQHLTESISQSKGSPSAPPIEGRQSDAPGPVNSTSGVPHLVRENPLGPHAEWKAAALGLTIAGLGLGTATGVAALNLQNELRQCQDTQCKRLAGTVHGLTAVSVVGLVVGAAGLAGGVTLFVLGGRQQTTTLRMEVRAGVSGVTVSGAF